MSDTKIYVLISVHLHIVTDLQSFNSNGDNLLHQGKISNFVFQNKLSLECIIFCFVIFQAIWKENI